MRAVLALLLLAVAAFADAQRIPVRADGYAKLLEREAVGRFGLDAPVALLAAQLHQESGWRTDAESPYAQGLAQFTPATAAWIPSVCTDLGPPNVWDARWSIRAQACYMRHLHRSISGAATGCERWAFALSAYNGGLGWVNRDRALASAKGADQSRWFAHTELHSKRAAWAFKENRDYPRRILLTLEPLYLRAGWAGRETCPEIARGGEPIGDAIAVPNENRRPRGEVTFVGTGYADFKIFAQRSRDYFRRTSGPAILAGNGAPGPGSFGAPRP